MESKPLSVFDSCEVVRLRPGDVVLYRCAKVLTDRQKEQVGGMLETVFPDHESIILDGGQDIAVLRPERGWWQRVMRKVEANG